MLVVKGLAVQTKHISNTIILTFLCVILIQISIVLWNTTDVLEKSSVICNQCHPSTPRSITTPLPSTALAQLRLRVTPSPQPSPLSADSVCVNVLPSLSFAWHSYGKMWEKEPSPHKCIRFAFCETQRLLSWAERSLVFYFLLLSILWVRSFITIFKHFDNIHMYDMSV